MRTGGVLRSRKNLPFFLSVFETSCPSSVMQVETDEPVCIGDHAAFFSRLVKKQSQAPTIPVEDTARGTVPGSQSKEAV